MPGAIPVASEGQLQWLVDRAAITDLFLAFARAIDDKDQRAYTDCFAEDGVVALPHGRFEGRDAILNMRTPPARWATHHLQAGHQILLNGDKATARVQMMAAHVFDAAVPGGNARAGGWYDAELTRTAAGWRLCSVVLTIIWSTGEMMPTAKGTP
ncbi:nuclear transport factor 2 family protein [Sphingomonas sp.]|jgi:ketosteroid isomerase-like protein|uniref:nuclear transport factor 2 family protein n=1 Tax=Sphingomonas sp. TaxID=28214 RepID=UPI002D7F1D5D|nr:nuclear transport factor 2 family protein [Sphingomonas sp.]HEU0044488.1 nuclear transport factor 2 family protein [Sphingomonas sp.]